MSWIFLPSTFTSSASSLPGSSPPPARAAVLSGLQARPSRPRALEADWRNQGPQMLDNTPEWCFASSNDQPTRRSRDPAYLGRLRGIGFRPDLPTRRSSTTETLVGTGAVYHLRVVGDLKILV